MCIVCSIDESTAARDAAEIAGQLARRMRAELVYVHSVTGESSERLGARSHRRCDLLIVGYTPRARSRRRCWARRTDAWSVVPPVRSCWCPPAPA